MNQLFEHSSYCDLMDNIQNFETLDEYTSNIYLMMKNLSDFPNSLDRKVINNVRQK